MNTTFQPEKMARVVASNIRRVREYRNFTQQYMADQLGISQNAYSKLELGVSKMTLERLFAIANLLHVSHTGLMEKHDADIVQLRIESADK